MCRQITSARVLLAAECDSWYSHQTMVWTFCGSLSGRDKICFYSAQPQTFSKAHPASFIFSGYQGFFLQGLTVTAHSHLVPGLRTSGAMPVLPPCVPLSCIQGQLFLYHFMAFGNEIF